MKQKPQPLFFLVIAFLVFIMALASTSYLGLAAYRVSEAVMVDDEAWPRPWPFPDPWLVSWHEKLLAARPPLKPGVLDMHGELPALQLRVYGLLGTSFVFLLASIFWLRAVLPKDHASR